MIRNVGGVLLGLNEVSPPSAQTDDSPHREESNNLYFDTSNYYNLAVFPHTTSSLLLIFSLRVLVTEL